MDSDDRILHPLRISVGSHPPGSGKGCAMNILSYINGDVEITDYPPCSARPLARMVQECNDYLGYKSEDGFLAPRDALHVLDLAWLTVGTQSADTSVVMAWLNEIIDDPTFGTEAVDTSCDGFYSVKVAVRDATKTVHEAGINYSNDTVKSRASLEEAAVEAAGLAAVAAYCGAGDDWLLAMVRHYILRWRHLAGLTDLAGKINVESVSFCDTKG